MGMKRRICDICKKRKRFDQDYWQHEGWTFIPETDLEGKDKHPTQCKKACPYCSGNTPAIRKKKQPSSYEEYKTKEEKNEKFNFRN